MSELTFQEKLAGDYYKNKLPYPEYRPKPDILRKKVDALNLSEAAFAAIQQAKADYQAACAGDEPMKAAYKAEDARLQQEFFDDLHEYHGVDPEHPFIRLIWSKAWEHGHSSGYPTNVAYWFEDLMDFWKEAEKMAAAVAKATTKKK